MQNLGFFSCLFTFFNFIFLEEKGNLAYALRRTLSCNHIRAYEYFIDSIKSENCQFIGIGKNHTIRIHSITFLMNYFIYFILFIECDSWKDFVAGECARYAS